MIQNLKIKHMEHFIDYMIVLFLILIAIDQTLISFLDDLIPMISYFLSGFKMSTMIDQHKELKELKSTIDSPEFWLNFLGNMFDIEIKRKQ